MLRPFVVLIIFGSPKYKERKQDKHSESDINQTRSQWPKFTGSSLSFKYIQRHFGLGIAIIICSTLPLIYIQSNSMNFVSIQSPYCNSSSSTSDMAIITVWMRTARCLILILTRFLRKHACIPFCNRMNMCFRTVAGILSHSRPCMYSVLTESVLWVLVCLASMFQLHISHESWETYINI